jgi:hypothetical protein
VTARALGRLSAKALEIYGEFAVVNFPDLQALGTMGQRTKTHVHGPLT